MDIELKPKKAARFLLVLVVGFTLAHIAGQLAEIHLGRTFGLFLFDLDREQSIPRFYSAVTLLLCSGLLLTIAVAKKRDDTRSFLYWLGLALIFLYLAIAENTAIQESLAAPIRSAINMSKIQFYAWVYGILLVIFPAVYLRFLLSLPRRTIRLFAIGGSAFVAGAFGLDLVAAYLGNPCGHHTATYIGLATVEEALEMAGIIVFVYALLSYMGSELKWIRVRIAEQCK
jgi:hypothetical protein